MCERLRHETHRNNNRLGLTIAFFITTGIVFLELLGAIWTKSLSLLSDSVHMASDSISLLFSLIAIVLSARISNRIGGYSHLELGATLFNAIALIAVPIWIVWEAVERFMNPREIDGLVMISVATIGLICNLLSARILMRMSDTRHNLNVRSAYLHVLADAWGSAGVILSGLCIHLLGWRWTDPLISLFMALIIAKGGVEILHKTILIIVRHYQQATNSK